MDTCITTVIMFNKQLMYILSVKWVAGYNCTAHPHCAYEETVCRHKYNETHKGKADNG